MANALRVFGLLLRKNLMVRKRHWMLTLFLQVLVPVLLFVLVQSIRDFTVSPPRVVNESTYFDVQTKSELLRTTVNSRFFYLLYAPSNPVTDELMESTRNCLSMKTDNVQGFDTEQEMLTAYTQLDAKDMFVDVLAVVFEKYDGTDLQYKIRHSKEISTQLFETLFSRAYGPSYDNYCSSTPFIPTQICIDESLINRVAPGAITGATEMSIQRVPYPPFIQISDGDTILRQVLCIFAVFAFLIPLCVEANYPAQEKAIGVNVLMSMNGVKLYQNLLSWLVTGMIVSLLYIIPILVLFKVTFSGNVEPFLYYGNAFIFWVVITTLVGHLIAFGMHIASYFSRPRFVMILLMIIYSAALALHGSLTKDESYGSLPFLGILFPNLLIFRFFEELNAYEAQLTGVNWSNLFIVGDHHYSTAGSVGFVFVFAVIGTILHFTLAVYINNIRPGKYGTARSPLYFLNSCMKKNRVYFDQQAAEVEYSMNDKEFERVERGVLTPGIQVRDVKKYYRVGWLRDSTVQALKGVSIDLYRGQITALLGHNGAGKTTLMSILTGVTSATDGTVYVNGRNIRTDLDLIRTDLGLCPQENMYFPDLNVLEHMEFFGMLKGAYRTRKEIVTKAKSILAKLKISEKEQVLPSKLSGGQKRRLCLGMALIGDATTVILDEPTSGMDPETRRDTWDIILKMRGEKTILISTHNMEEADILGDRIAILHGGRLKSYGTGMFLKKQHGHGCVEVTLSTKQWCSPDTVRSKFDPKTETVTADEEKLVLSVPHTSDLPKSLDIVESEKKSLGVTGVSVSLITLEQVFLNIVKKEESGKPLTDFFGDAPEKLTGFSYYLQTISALYEKNFTYARKNIATLLIMIFLPLLAIGITALNHGSPSTTMAVFPLRMDRYRSPRAFYSSSNAVILEQYGNAVKFVGGIPRNVSDFASVSDALLDDGKNDLAEYRNTLIAAAEFNVTDTGITANALYSGTAIHSIPISVNLLSNAVLKAAAGDQYSISVSSQHLPESLSQAMRGTPGDEPISRVVVFCICFFPTVALFTIRPAQERLTLVKQLQRMTGVNSVTYWLTTFTSDFLIYLTSVGVTLLGFYTVDRLFGEELYRETEIFVMMLILILFGINALLVAYIFTFWGKTRNSLITLLSIGPLAFAIGQYLLNALTGPIPSVKILYDLQRVVLPVVPYVSLFQGQVNFFETAVHNARCRRLPNRLLEVVCERRDICCAMDCWNGSCKRPLPYFSNFQDDFTLESCLTYMGLAPILYFLILILLEERCVERVIAKLRKKGVKTPCDRMDEQVRKEKEEVAKEINKLNSDGGSSSGIEVISKMSIVSQSDLVRSSETDVNSLYLAYEMSKYYGDLMAVREISFRVKQRECFGLLGVNGAGKSTTFRMLTGEEIPDSGIMYLKQWNIGTSRKNYLAEMAYCPQTDALLESLNTFDHLRLFGLLRGVPRSKIDLEVNRWINRLNLTACMKQPSGTYSGGNKRRLNIAMALIGNPTLVLLDEPTTGVDPAARRSLWTVLQACQATGQAIILTSHSMEECEALCNRLVIMVKGQLVCVGASQELKQRFGAGYDIQIKLSPNRADEDVVRIKEKIEAALTCDLTDENLGYLAYHVTNARTTWQTMYSTMDSLKATYSAIEDYAVLSATLERLFLQFARGIEVAARPSETSPPSSTSHPAKYKHL